MIANAAASSSSTPTSGSLGPLSKCSGIGVRLETESVFDLRRNTHLRSDRPEFVSLTGSLLQIQMFFLLAQNRHRATPSA
jgi:hypothetical protein